MYNIETSHPNSSANTKEHHFLHVAYGPLRDHEIMERIVGGPVKLLGHVAISDVVLVEQKLSHLPEEAQIVLNEQGVNPELFSSTSLSREGVKENDGVGGTLYALTHEQAKRLDDYELVDKKWFERQDVQVINPEGEALTASTHVLPSNALHGDVVEEIISISPAERESHLANIDSYHNRNNINL